MLIESSILTDLLKNEEGSRHCFSFSKRSYEDREEEEGREHVGCG